MALSLEFRHLCKSFRSNGEKVRSLKVFDDFNLLIERGTFVSILGPSGCGKSTLLRILAGLEDNYQGDVLLDGNHTCGRDKRIGMVFQEYALFPWLTTQKNIEVGLDFAGIPKKERRDAAREYIQSFGLNGFESFFPKELSGGMKQRVGIARALITNPQVVLMDEPFGSLDSQNRNDMQTFLLNVWMKRRDTILFVTHNVDEAVQLSDRIVVLSKRPAKILKIYDNNIPHPRDRTSWKSNLLRREILSLLETPNVTMEKS